MRVDGLSLDVAPGEVLGLVGESGSGKSVTLRAIGQLLHGRATVSGRVLWQGEDLLAVSPDSAARRPRRRDRHGIPGADGGAEPGAVHRAADRGVAGRPHHPHPVASAGRGRWSCSAWSGFPSPAQRLGQFTHEFSGGMRQRAMIAIALAAAPKLLLADEPTTALDVTIQDQVLKLLLRLVDELGMALVLVTHDLGVVAETCDRMAVMYAGRICEVGPVEPCSASRATPIRTRCCARCLATARRAARCSASPASRRGSTGRCDGCAFAPRCGHAEPRCTQMHAGARRCSPRGSVRRATRPIALPAARWWRHDARCSPSRTCPRRFRSGARS